VIAFLLMGIAFGGPGGPLNLHVILFVMGVLSFTISTAAPSAWWMIAILRG